MTALAPELAELAALFHVAVDYEDWRGRRVAASSETVVAVLGALGVDATTPEAARRAVAERHLARWRRMLPPVLVTRVGWTPRFPVHVTHGDPLEVWARLEDGSRRDMTQVDRVVEPVSVDGRLVGEATFEVPADLPLGWHVLHARSDAVESSATLVVTPQRLELPPALRHGRAWGFMAQLYQLRSRRSWGVGDLDDLAELVAWSGRELGAGFVLVNPLHAAEPVPPQQPSPYLPTSRRYANPLYLRVEAVPEIAYLPAPERSMVDFVAEERRRRSDPLLDRDGVWEAKRSALEKIFRVPRTLRREAAYRAYKAREGHDLVDFATWSALAETHGLPWSRWPEPLQDPRSEQVARARSRADVAARVEFHCWLQWLLDDQIAEAQRAARDAGMPVGVVHDLPVGVNPRGADAWVLQQALASEVAAGAPPDAFNQQGQGWSSPPWHPERLAEAGYQPYRAMLRNVFRHAGAIRLDHIVGLFRLWWVPHGMPPSAGTYVRYDHEALVGILALEAERADALVIGEDLGTVEPWVRDYLAERGVLGTSVLWFERDAEGRPLAPERWRELCLATVTTHDLPPSAGYLAGDHVTTRDRLGLLTRPVAEEHAAHARERAAWLGELDRMGLLRPGATGPEVVEALHRAVARAPAKLIGVALADAAGDRRAPNQPGADTEYPSWRLPLADPSGRPVLLDDLMAGAGARALARAVGG